MPPNLRSSIARVNQNKRVKAIALEVMGGRASVKLAGSSQVLYGLSITGGTVIAGQEVYVDYTTGQPVVHSYQEQTVSTTVTRIKTRVITTDPDFPGSGSSTQHTHTKEQIIDLLLPQTSEPQTGFYLTGYDDATGLFTSGSPTVSSGSPTEFSGNHNELDNLQGGKAGTPNPTMVSGGSEIIYTLNGTTYKAHIFTTSGSLILGNNVELEYLIVGGGGSTGGGVNGVCYDAPGGGGEVKTGTQEFSAGTISVIVGNETSGFNTNGNPSSLGNITCNGGNAGYVQGHGGASGDGHTGSARSGSTSGGAGGDNANSSGINGGNGTQSSIIGTPTYYGGGGAGAGYNVFGTPGLGTGVANSGGGGNGGNETHPNQKGFSGIVIVRYVYSDDWQAEFYHLKDNEYEFLQEIIATGGSNITGGSPIQEAPNDDIGYVRKNNEWASGDYRFTPTANSSESHGTTSNGSSITFAHTVTGGSDTILLVGVSSGNDAVTVSSVTYNGKALTKINEVGGGSFGRSQMWYRLLPDIGTYNVVVTFSGNTYGEAGAIAYDHVDQTLPFRNEVENTGADEITVVSSDGDLVVGMVSLWWNTSLGSDDAGQTSIWVATSDGSWQGLMSSKKGTESTILRWTLLTTYSSIMAISLHGSTGYQTALADYATGNYGLDSDANMKALYDLVMAMRTTLVNAGLMKGSQ